VHRLTSIRCTGRRVRSALSIVRIDH
jgi:hypothetical protein